MVPSFVHWCGPTSLNIRPGSDLGRVCMQPMIFLEYLRRLNRKERFFLVGMALGNPSFELAPAFRDLIGGALGLKIPHDSFVAMDYHLDWIYASLEIARTG